MVTLVFLLKRKPGLTRAAFRDYYETRHAPLMCRLAPGMISYRRQYLDPLDSAEPPFDVVTEVRFPDRAALDRMLEFHQRPEVAAEKAADEAQLFDVPAIRSFLVEECRSVLPLSDPSTAPVQSAPS